MLRTFKSHLVADRQSETVESVITSSSRFFAYRCFMFR